MNILQDPEIKTTYEKCKYKVKLWENQFKKQAGRLPSKLDIREANSEVRNAYKTYFRLKTAALEESLMHIDGFDAEPKEQDTNDTVEHSTALDKSLNMAADTPANTDICDVSCNINSKDTWGVHLNRKDVHSSSDIKNKSEKLNVNLSFSQKLFEGSKFSKRLPRKSLSFNRKKSESDTLKPQFLSQPDSSLSFTEHSQTEAVSPETKTEEISFPIHNSIINVTPSIISHPVNIIQSSVSNNYNYKPVRKVDAGWIRRITENAGSDFLDNNLMRSNTETVQTNSDITKVDYDSDDVIANSEDEQDTSSNVYHFVKKRKTLDNTIVQEEPKIIPNTLATVDIAHKRLDFSNIFDNKDLNKNNAENNEIETDIVVKNNKAGFIPTDVYEFESESEEQQNKAISVNSKKKLNKTSNQHNSSQKNLPGSLRRSNRNHKPLVNTLQQSDTENEDPFHSDNDINDPEFDIKNPDDKNFGFRDDITNDIEEKVKKSKIKPKKSENSTRVQKKLSKNKSEETQIQPENSSQTYELEYSIKPRIVTVPRIKNIKQAVSTRKTPKSKSQSTDDVVVNELINTQKNRSQEKLLKKVESGTLNDNYVQINLKKKIYVRGKSTRSFSKFKKQQWKNKKNALYGPNMDMGGCDGGFLTCFNCGQTGHFARNCKAAKGDALLPYQEEEEICPYPTLEEAAKMAKESVLAIRKPNQVPSDEINAEITEINPEIASTSQNQSENQDDNPFACEDDGDADLLAETERLEQEIAKIDVQNYIDMTTYVKPYFNLQDGKLIETPQEVFNTLHKFGHDKFRDGQELAIMRILSGKSTLVTLSTGSGKSLCYQLPAYLYSQREPCISLIISPLVSLMEDQVTGIPAFLKAACLHTNQTKIQREKIMEAIRMGNLNILLVSPEAVVAGERSSGFGSLLRQLPPIAFACIDEAHCVSQWSHNFRPSYLKICRVLRERLGVKTVLGLTATATRATSDSIIRHICIPDGRDGIISDIPLPDNLKLTVSRDFQRDQALLTLLLSEEFSEYRSIIVYCTRREECQRVATFLRTCLKDEKVVDTRNKKRKRFNVQAEPYHAGMAASRRKTIQKAFMAGELRIVVATVAFGMGINKSDIRAVIHYNMPMSFESYVQEVGRAGRDGLPAHCHLFLDSQGRDENELRRHIYANSTDRHVIRKLLQRCFVPCSCKTVCPRHEVAFSIQETVQALDIPEENIETLLCYLELHDKQYVELLSHAYVTCKIISYGGPNQIRKAAKECPPLAMAMALHQKNNDKDDNIFEFPVVEVASAIGWDSGICKHKLKNLEWCTENNQSKRSKLTVQFSNLGFRLLAPGNLPDSELDEALDSLYGRVKEQEHTAMLQLHGLHATLTSVASATFKMCISEDITENEKLLKFKIREYFESSKPLELLPEPETKPIKEDQIVNDVRSLVCMYRDNSFTGRAVARIFHGIQSPNYPAVIWGRCKFWRAHLGTDFNALCTIATKEILRMK